MTGVVVVCLLWLWLWLWLWLLLWLLLLLVVVVFMWQTETNSSPMLSQSVLPKGNKKETAKHKAVRNIISSILDDHKQTLRDKLASKLDSILHEVWSD